jgi:hypothetical protein
MKYFISFLGALFLLAGCGTDDDTTAGRGSALISTPSGAYYALSCLNQKKSLKQLTEATAQECLIDKSKLESLTPQSNKRNMYYVNYWYYTAYMPYYGYNAVNSFCRGYFNSSTCLGMNPVVYTNNGNTSCTYLMTNYFSPAYQRNCSSPPSTTTGNTQTVNTSGIYYYPTPRTYWFY